MKLKKKVIVFMVVISIIISEVTGVLPYLAARLSTSIYITSKHKDINFKFQYVEYSPQFGDYIVVYKDNNGKNWGFMVTPKILPIIILYDPLVGGA